MSKSPVNTGFFALSPLKESRWIIGNPSAFLCFLLFNRKLQKVIVCKCPLVVCDDQKQERTPSWGVRAALWRAVRDSEPALRQSGNLPCADRAKRLEIFARGRTRGQKLGGSSRETGNSEPALRQSGNLPYADRAKRLKIFARGRTRGQKLGGSSRETDDQKQERTPPRGGARCTLEGY